MIFIWILLGGGAQGRETKTKSSKGKKGNKNKKAAFNDDSDDENVVAKKSPALEFMTLDDLSNKLGTRYRPRFFDQVGHQTTSAYIENKHFFTKSCHRQTYQNYEQPPQCLHYLSFFGIKNQPNLFQFFFSVMNI